MRLSDINNQFRNLPLEKAQANARMQVELEGLREQIKALHVEIQRKEEQFERDWAQRQRDMRAQRDEAIKQEFRDGATGTKVMTMLGTNNTKLVYKLRDEVLGEIAAEHREANAPAAPEPKPAPAPAPAEQDTDLDSIQWQHHMHTAVYGWLISSDETLVKVYAPDADPEDYDDEDWFVATRDRSFVTGSKELFDAVSPEEFEKRVSTLLSLLAGTYTGRMRLSKRTFTT